MTMLTLFEINAVFFLVAAAGAAILTWMLAAILKKPSKREAVRYLSETERALQALDYRYERGEMSADEYRMRRAVLLSQR